eukprot:scaffold134910_cov102-Phaeocystis_antarctica.AAC.1
MSRAAFAEAAHTRTRLPEARQCCTRSRISRDLPIPPSPERKVRSCLLPAVFSSLYDSNWLEVSCHT